MLEIYRLPRDGGPQSPRFHAYVTAGHERLPVAGYNPMTGQDVASTIEALLAIDAEGLVADAASEVGVGAGGDDPLFVTVATPGMWTERFATEVHHRLGPVTGQVLLWTGEDVSPEAVRREAIAQAVRLQWRPVARTVAEVAAREGAAYARAGEVGALDEGVAEALEVVGDDEGIGTMAAFLYGDEVAVHLGWSPLGLGPLAGYRHAIAAAAATTPPAG